MVGFIYNYDFFYYRVPYIVEVLNFMLVGRKYMLTAGRVGPLPPSCTVVQSTGSALNTVGRQKSETETQR